MSMDTFLEDLTPRAVVLCALVVLTLGGSVLLMKSGLMPHSDLPAILFFGGVFFALPLAAGELMTMGPRKRLAQMREQDFASYRNAHPDLVRDGRVICNQCGGERIHVRGLLRHTHLRVHFCTQCGATLYYSREGQH